jgi:hemin uptake protein HemP
MSNNEAGKQNESSGPEEKPSGSVLRAEELFQGKREIWIEHDGKHYRLRITRRNKLILQK